MALDRTIVRSVLARLGVAVPFLLTLCLVGPAASAVTPPVARVADRYEASLRSAARDLPLAAERPTGYDRDLFDLWIDADGDGCDTREEVLILESTAIPDTGTGCAVTGAWFSYYDRLSWTDPSDVDIDHLVPLKEAWDSGAWNWDEDTRRRYANDLAAPRSLVAVTDNVNQSKGERDFAELTPQYQQCRYVADWIATKIRWSQYVDQPEQYAVIAQADACPDKTLKIKVAVIGAEPPPRDADAVIASIRFDPRGGDIEENDEHIVLRNTGTEAADLAGWTITDYFGTSYTVKPTAIPPNGRLIVHSGRGYDSRRHQYAAWGWTWNNTGDTATLRKPSGAVADTCTYVANASGSVAC